LKWQALQRLGTISCNRWASANAAAHDRAVRDPCGGSILLERSAECANLSLMAERRNRVSAERCTELLELLAGLPIDTDDETG
jgi:hypothetical protein